MVNVALIGGTGMVVSVNPASKAPRFTGLEIPQAEHTQARTSAKLHNR